MSGLIEYYGGLSSPWTYLGHQRLIEIAQSTNTQIHFKLVDLPKVFSQTGGLPLDKRPPARRAYRMQELIRWREETGVPLHLEPKYFPVPHTKAALTVIAAQSEGDSGLDLGLAYMQAVWVNDLNIDDTDTVVKIASDAGFEGKRLFEKGHSDDIIAIYDKYTDEAITKGVFGAPTYIIGDNVYWGQDRLGFVEKKLKEVKGN